MGNNFHMVNLIYNWVTTNLLLFSENSPSICVGVLPVQLVPDPFHWSKLLLLQSTIDPKMLLLALMVHWSLLVLLAQRESQGLNRSQCTMGRPNFP
jgi:hypothetical protein